MERAKILQGLAPFSAGSVWSAPDRGPWGDKAYRGNCSGWHIAGLIQQYLLNRGGHRFAELFAGGGTGYDVARDMGVSYVGADLNPAPVRPGILRVDAIRDEVPAQFYDAELLFMHPPYGEEIHIPYAGSMYPDPTGVLSRSDLGQMPWPVFIKALNGVIMKYWSTLSAGSYLSILMGDVRRSGRVYSMFTDIVKPGRLEQVIIKTQHNCVSDGRSYTGKNFVPITHEYILVMKKDNELIISFQLPKTYEKDIRDSETVPWKAVVKAVLNNLGGKAPLSQIYDAIAGFKRAKMNQHWREKVRQTLQLCEGFSSEERGVWQLCAA